MVPTKDTVTRLLSPNPATRGFATKLLKGVARSCYFPHAVGGNAEFTRATFVINIYCLYLHGIR